MLSLTSAGPVQASRRTLLKGLAGLGIAASGCGEAFAETYPNRVIRIIVPTSPGGGNDTIARVIGQQLQNTWNQSIIIDNRPGADGTIGAAVVSKSPPDGYTLMLCTSAVLTINPPLYPSLPYDPIKDFTPVTVASSAPFLLVVHPSLPVNSVAELIAYAKANPNKINFSSSGVGSVTHLAGAMFNKMAGIEMVHIPYKGSAPAMTDLLSGRVPLRITVAGGVLPFLKTGELKALAVTSPDKYSLMPELPTIAETVPGYSASIWYGLVGPAGMPDDIANTLQSEIAKQLKSPEVKAKLDADGSQGVGNTPKEFAQMMKSETAQWTTIIRDNNIRPE
jgi:tripartite-type tricarboxylate transporter receptor subunit TctC